MQFIVYFEYSPY